MDERSRDGGDAGRKGVAREDEHLVETPLWPGLEPKVPAAPNSAAAGGPAEAGAQGGEAATGEKRRRRPRADAGAGEGAGAAASAASAGAAAIGGGEGDARAPGEPETPLRFEEAVAALEEAVRKLEAGDLPLEEAMRLFQDGVRLSRRCAALLDEAERKMELLLAQEGEAPTLKPYDMPPGPGRGAQGA